MNPNDKQKRSKEPRLSRPEVFVARFFKEVYKILGKSKTNKKCECLRRCSWPILVVAVIASIYFIPYAPESDTEITLLYYVFSGIMGAILVFTGLIGVFTIFRLNEITGEKTLPYEREKKSLKDFISNFVIFNSSIFLVSLGFLIFASLIHENGWTLRSFYVIFLLVLYSLFLVIEAIRNAFFGK